MKLVHGSGDVTQFKVPAGKNIFDQTFDDSSSTGQDNFDVTDVSSSFSQISGSSSATFCHACGKNGYRWGDTCWALTPTSDSNRGCGCCSGGWTGSGVYYGGYKDPQVCGGQGGGFTGGKDTGVAKGNLPSIGLTMYIMQG